MVRRRHDHDRLGAGRRPLPPRRRGRLRGRHRRLPQPPGRRDRPAITSSASAATPSTTRVADLTAWLLDALTGLRHANGRPVVRDPRPDRHRSTAAARSRSSCATATAARSTTVGSRSSPTTSDISLRTGCFCNPGAGEIAHHLGAADMVKWFDRERVDVVPRAARAAARRARPARGRHPDLRRRGHELRRRLPVHVLHAGLRRPHGRGDRRRSSSSPTTAASSATRPDAPAVSARPRWPSRRAAGSWR